MNYSDYIIYVDESGDHQLEKIDRDYPVFVLDFCIFDKKSYVDTVVPQVQALKFDYFGHDTVVLHEREIRKQEKPFSFLQKEDRRREFMERLNTIIEQTNFTIIATAIRKEKIKERYSSPENIYETSLKFCMERTHAFLKEKGQHLLKTHIVVEARGNNEDKELELAFRRIRDGENYQGPMPNFEIIFASKGTNSAGLQVADLTARPIGRHVLNPEQTNRSWDIIEKKLRRDGSGQTRGRGLKIFPDP